MLKEHRKVLKAIPVSQQINLILIFFMFMSVSLDFKREMIYGLGGGVYHFSVLKKELL